jgi:protein-L-isoaspartate(D-aspartate) O-methyltransferase
MDFKPLSMIVLLAAAGCTGAAGMQKFADGGRGPDFGKMREAMVERQIEARGVRDPGTLKAMRMVRRELFVPADLQYRAYQDSPLPIGEDQTISQPYIVAVMNEALAAGPDSRVLEIGTGSGYSTAILAEVAARVFTIEIIPVLAERAKSLLEGLGYANIRYRTGDGYAGWPEEAPFDAILVTAAPPEVPAPLAAQLKTGGRLVIPVGTGSQDLLVYKKKPDGSLMLLDSMPVRFVPMTGEAQKTRKQSP